MPLEEYALINDDAGSLAPPTAIGPYRVLHQVGAGVLGPVFRAHSADAGREVAVKLFRLDLTPEQSTALAEALGQVCARLPEHDHLAAPRAAGLLGACTWLASDYIPADALDSRLRRRSALGLRHALPILRQVAAALDAAAAAGIHHGSLHPRDVLVTTTGEVRVTGFGVTDAIEGVGGAPLVRRPYTAPERVSAPRAPSDAAADVFALAAIAVELLTGRRLVGTGAAAVGLVSGVSEGVDADLCRRALARALSDVPADRFSSGRAFVEALERAVADSTALESDTQGGVPPSHVHSRRRHVPEAAAGGQLPAPAPSQPAQEVEPPDAPHHAAVPPDAGGEEEAAAGEAHASPGTAVQADAEAGPEGPPPPPPEDLPIRADVAVDAAASEPAPVVPGGVPLPADSASPRHDVGTPRAARLRAAIAAALLAGVALGLLAGYLAWGRRPVPAGARPVAPPAASAPSVPAPPRAVSPSAAPLPPPERLAREAPARSAGSAVPVGAATKPRQPTAQAARAPAARPTAPTHSAPRAPARVEFVSRPAGARVYVDGRAVGRTPITAEPLGPGRRAVRLQLDGYRPWATTLHLEPGQRARVAASLELTAVPQDPR